MKLSIVTSTYNRIDLLSRLIESLQHQSDKKFEWILIDDGSTDSTKEHIKSISEQFDFDFKYRYQNNSGKHVALNRGFNEANGDYLIILDSDDLLSTDAVDKILKAFDDIKKDNDIGVISFCNQTLEQLPIGNQLSGFTCSQLDYIYKYKGTGDRSEVFKKTIYKEFRFPIFDNERFCPEALVWNRIGLKYKTKYVSDVIKYVEYQSDGLTSKIIQIRAESPNSTLLYYRELFYCAIPSKDKFKACINFWRFSCHSKFKVLNKNLDAITGYDIVSMPFGFMFFLKDKYLK
jgi:glycosyltransferase involved in cell wall biosynthesis